MALTPEQTAQIQGALNPSIQFALPQTVVPITKTQRQVQSVQYDPEKIQALIKALQSKRVEPSKMDVLASVLAQAPEAKSYKGGFGEEIINPWASGFSALARGFGEAYTKRSDAKREAENAAREDAIKAAQLEAEASKQAITDTRTDDWMKVNDPSAKTLEQLQKEEEQKQAALSALHTLDDLAKNGGINALNKSTDNWALSGESSKNIGRREQALSTLIPMTAKVAHDAGISGINSVGEAMLYLGIPENATSKQIEGMLPGVIKKLGLESDFYQRSPISDGMAF